AAVLAHARTVSGGGKPIPFRRDSAFRSVGQGRGRHRRRAVRRGDPAHRRPGRRFCPVGPAAGDAAGTTGGQRTGSGTPGTSRRWSRQEIFPLPATSPAVFGKLSRRLPSELVVHNCRPRSTGLVGNSSGPSLRRLVAGSTGLRKNSLTPPRWSTTAIV